ncbi:MAG: hypothetical protein ACKVG6_11425 [Alphaproteobacteria bacterium]
MSVVTNHNNNDNCDVDILGGETQAF